MVMSNVTQTKLTQITFLETIGQWSFLHVKDLFDLDEYSMCRLCVQKRKMSAA